MTKTLLFDLDGTLLPMDTEVFVKQYLEAFVPVVKEHIHPETFTRALLKGTGAMLTNLDRDKTNEQVFMETFLSITQVDKMSFWPILEQFYEDIFPTLAKYTQPTKYAPKVLEEALNQGYQLVIATNPVFPKRAIEHRLAWAAIDQYPFELITVYEDSNFTKPHLQYYEMILERLGLTAEECMMIGNDMQEDMCTSQLGMRTYLVEDCLIDRGSPEYPVDGRGSLADLYQLLKSRTSLFAK